MFVKLSYLESLKKNSINVVQMYLSDHTIKSSERCLINNKYTHKHLFSYPSVKMSKKLLNISFIIGTQKINNIFV